MQEARFSTIRFNEWICVTAQYEKAVARLGRQVYQGYSRGLITDYTTLEMCKEISEAFAEAREIRADMEEELERDALDGLNVEEAAKADEVRQLTQTEHAKRKVKLKFTKFLGRQAINRSLAAHRNRVKELSRDLGLKALTSHTEAPLIQVKGHKALCRLADRLQDDANKKWQEIAEANKKTGGGLSFHTILFNFVGNFASFSKGTYVGKFLLKFFKYNEKEEEQKLSKQFEGTNTAEALRAQMEEIDEPHLDVGREIDNMQQEYEETPEEWNLADSGDSEAQDFPSESSPAVEKWGSEADTWSPDSSADEDFLGAVATAPDLPTADEEFEPEAAAARPTLLRKRAEPEAGNWQEDQGIDVTPMHLEQEKPGPEPEHDYRPDPFVAGANPKPEQEDDWGWGTTTTETEDNSWGKNSSEPELSPEKAPSSDIFEQEVEELVAEIEPADLFADAPDPLAPEKPTEDPFGDQFVPEQPDDKPAEMLSRPSGKRPPFIKATKTENPEKTWQAPDEKSVPPDDKTLDTDTGPATDFRNISIPMPEGAEEGSIAPAPINDLFQDPLLQLVPQDKAETEPEPEPDKDSEPILGDNLLPEFLRERKEDESNTEDSAFIPELPSFLEEGPDLEILPFGSSSRDKKDDEEGNSDPFIPKMP